jgi:hypothetical protein
MSKVYCQVYRTENHRLIADQVEVACSFFSRLRGLLGRTKMTAGSGLILQPCSSIHCFGMRFPIDAIFLDRQHRVITIKENMPPAPGPPRNWLTPSWNCAPGSPQASDLRRRTIKAVLSVVAGNISGKTASTQYH